MVTMETKPRFNQRKADVALALVTPALVIAFTFIVIPIYFPTNDDSFAQQIFAGSISGEPLPYVTFMGYALCWLVSKLFVAVPGDRMVDGSPSCEYLHLSALHRIGDLARLASSRS